MQATAATEGGSPPPELSDVQSASEAETGVSAGDGPFVTGTL